MQIVNSEGVTMNDESMRSISRDSNVFKNIPDDTSKDSHRVPP